LAVVIDRPLWLGENPPYRLLGAGSLGQFTADPQLESLTRFSGASILESLLREASVPKRVARARSLSRSVILLVHRAIRRANPSLSDRDADLIFVEKHYGQDVAEHLRQFLTQRTR